VWLQEGLEVVGVVAAWVKGVVSWVWEVEPVITCWWLVSSEVRH
jgi:hypothetical protein